jgi:hypothetical protein
VRPRALLIVVVMLVVLLPASASGYLYWSGGDEVARANLNGSGLESGFIPKLSTGVLGVAVSTQYVYFAGEQGLIGRASLSGGDVDSDLFRIPQPAPGLYEPVEVDAISLVVAGGHIYWSSSESSIGRASVDGGGIEPAFIKTEARVSALAVDASQIYWATERDMGLPSRTDTSTGLYSGGTVSGARIWMAVASIRISSRAWISCLMRLWAGATSTGKLENTNLAWGVYGSGVRT